MRTIIIVELPDDADLTKYRANINIEKIRECGYDYEPYTFRLFCPLKPLPEKEMILNYPEYRENDYSQGWNDCLKEIIGETEWT